MTALLNIMEIPQWHHFNLPEKKNQNILPLIFFVKRDITTEGKVYWEMVFGNFLYQIVQRK